MLGKSKLRLVTRGLDAILIWSSAVSILVGLVSFIEGLGAAISLLIALAILPLALISFVLLRHHKQVAAGIRSYFVSLGAGRPDQVNYMYDPQDEASDITAYYDLMQFVLEYLLPACEAQINLQEKVIDCLCKNKEIAELAKNGIPNAPDQNVSTFLDNYSRLVRGIDSSEPTIRFSVMMNIIRGMERDAYKGFCGFTDKIARESGLIYADRDELAELWETWRQRHNSLVGEYENVKRDVRYSKLFFPRREGRWGDIISPSEAVEDQASSSRTD
jgi:hypothetical protein